MQNKQFNPIRLFLTIFLVPKNLQNALVDFQKNCKRKISLFTALRQEATEQMLYAMTMYTERRTF